MGFCRFGVAGGTRYWPLKIVHDQFHMQQRSQRDTVATNRGKFARDLYKEMHEEVDSSIDRPISMYVVGCVAQFNAFR